MTIEGLISKRLSRAVMEYNLIKPGETLLAAYSGGKDSAVMLHQLAQKSRAFSIPFQLEAVHVAAEYTSREDLENIREFCREIDVELTILNIQVQRSLPEGKKINCFNCSRMRRKALFEYAESRGCGTIAMGHHMDDILESFFMNMIYRSELAATLPRQDFEKLNKRIIRPLSLVQEKQVIRYCREKGWGSFSCSCPFEGDSRRKKMRQFIAQLSNKEGDFVRKNIYDSLGNINRDFLLEKANFIN